MKKIKLIICILIIVLLPVVFLLFFKDNSQLEDGVYRVQENALYPDAYITVQDGFIQFLEIDLNALYKDEMVARYIHFQESEYGNLTDDEKREIRESVDLNAFLCEQPYELNYDMQIKEGANEFSNMFCKVNSINRFGYLYNTSTKTISIGDGPSKEFNFKK